MADSAIEDYTPNSEEHEEIIKEAKTRFEYALSYESETRKLFLQDVKFANADSDNGYQWPQEIKSDRDLDDRPVLTINKTRQHNLQIINDAKQNKPGVTIRPVGNEATYESAEIFEGVIRHIEYISNAQAAYDRATEYQVEGGVGYWRILTDYANDNSFDQEIFIRPIRDMLSVLIDPDTLESDKSDMRWAFVFDDMPNEVFKTKYPQYKNLVGTSAINVNMDQWCTKDHTRVAEYYRVVEKEDELLAFNDSAGKQHIMLKSDVPKELRADVLADETLKTRKVITRKVEWKKLAANKVIEEKDWPGVYIPIVQITGSERIIEGKLDRKGHTRNLKDPQRIYNYWASSAVEVVCLQGKAPYIAPARAIEGYEEYWNNANTVNYSVLPYNDVSEDGQTIVAPERSAPPVMAPAYIQGLQISAQDMEYVSGQFEATFGQPGNETSGKAIDARQRRGDRATYHFIDNLGLGIRYTGKILIDLIPKIYDTERVIKMMGEDGVETEVLIDPEAKEAYLMEQKTTSEKVKTIFNPNVGKYAVEADVGPGYATKRQEAWNAFTQIVSQNQALTNVIGDLMFENADFPGAKELAKRMRRMVPKQALGEGPSPEEQQLQIALQSQQGMVNGLLQQLGELQLQLTNKSKEVEVKQYDAITDRLKTLLEQQLNPKDIAGMVHDLMKEEHRHELSVAATAMEPQNEPAAQ